MVIYVDLVFIINFVIDFILLYASGRLQGTRIRVIRLLLASFLGGGATLVTSVFGASVFIKAISSILMVVVAFSFGNIKRFMKNYAFFILTYALCGGIIFSISTFYPYIKATTLNIILGIGIAFVICIFLSAKMRVTQKEIAKLFVEKKGKTYTFDVLIDSGNLLTDSKTSLPVILCVDKFGFSGREILYKTASGMGKTEVFYPDKIKVLKNGEMFEGKDVLIGRVSGKLGNDFDAIMGGSCFGELYKKDTFIHKKHFARRWSLLHRRDRATAAAFESEGRKRIT